MGKYTCILYETGDDGITKITLNRPPVNAFNRVMSSELVLALDRFEHDENGKALVLTGAGRAFSTGEDLRNINLDASNQEMREYAEEALRDYHNIIRTILRTGKPIIAALNGVAAGAGMSIALACDYRILAVNMKDYGKDKRVFIPAFADMGLIADSGMTATLPRLIGRQEAQRWCDSRSVEATILTAIDFGIIDQRDARWLSGENFSCVAYALSKEMRNSALVYKLNKRVFPWELRAQTACLQSDYFKEKARAFLSKQKAKEAK